MATPVQISFYSKGTVSGCLSHLTQDSLISDPHLRLISSAKTHILNNVTAKVLGDIAYKGGQALPKPVPFSLIQEQCKALQ